MMNALPFYALITWLWSINTVNSLIEYDWCSTSLSCEKQGTTYKNTMCENTIQSSAGKCTDIRIVTDASIRKQMLELHNQFRDELARGHYTNYPKASNMMLMTWDKELELVAAVWNAQCIHEHDKCRRTMEFKHVGQNWGYRGNSSGYPNPNDTFKAWVAEMNDCDDKVIQPYPGPWTDPDPKKPIGHFTQVAWAGSYKVGCSVLKSKSGTMLTVYTTCNYGPAGNIRRGAMYKQGDPCTACDPSSSCEPNSQFPNLCVRTGSKGSYDYDYDVVAENPTGAGARLTNSYPFEVIVTLIIISVIWNK